jgi:hypothetical protein
VIRRTNRWITHGAHGVTRATEGFGSAGPMDRGHATSRGLDNGAHGSDAPYLHVDEATAVITYDSPLMANLSRRLGTRELRRTGGSIYKKHAAGVARPRLRYELLTIDYPVPLTSGAAGLDAASVLA